MKKITLFLVGIGLAFTGFSQVPLYTQDFESGAGGWVTGGTSTWALGTPAGPIINSAASGANAFATNLTGNYNANENGTVTSPTIDITAANGAEVLKMNVWWNSEFSWDGANIFGSYDNGTTWNIIGAVNDPVNWYNDGSINGTPNASQIGWTGRISSNNGSGGWLLAEHTLDSAMLVNSDSLMLRVGFGSDGSIQDEGFAFDDIFVGENLQNDAGISGFPGLAGISPGLQNIDVTLENFGTFILNNVNIDWSINGVLQPAPMPFAGNLASGASTIVTLANFNILAGTTTIKAWTSLPNGLADLGNGNDTTELTFCTGLSGTFTLGGVGADFVDFTDLSNSLNACGIGGPVVVNVAPGTYTGRLILDHVLGTSMTNTITINGGNASLVTLTNATFSNVYLNGTSWTTIKNMTLENLGTSDCYGVQLRDFASNNTIDSCIINMNITDLNLFDVVGVNSSDSETIDTQEGDNAFFTTISNCQINGGEIGIRLEGANASRNIGNRVINNMLDLCEDGGIFVDDQDSLSIIGNTITNLRNAFADGINLTDIMMFDISYNTVVNAPDIGFNIADGNFDAVPTSRGRIVNNMVSAGVDYAAYFDDMNETDVFHNTFSNIGGTNAAFRVNDIANVDIRNNIFVSDADFAFDSSDPITTGANIVDFNNYWSNGPNLVDDGFAVSVDLVAWQTVQPLFNIGSLETDPIFVSSLDLHATSPLIDNSGDNTVGVLDDIDGDVRPLAPGTIVDMGADEFTAPPVDAGIISIDNLTNPITAGIQSIDVTIRNFGALALTSANIEWSANGVAQAPFSWMGNLAPIAIDTPTIGAYNFPAGITEICAWSAMPNGMVDPNNANDTVCVTFCTPLVGVYTLGGVGADFATFTELGELLSTCGVGSAVTVNVAPGTYNDRLILDHIPGTSMANTLTINGGDASLVTLSNTTFSNVYLNGSSWTTIKNMTLENLGTNDCYGVQLRDFATNNTIDSCIINLNTTATGLGDVIGVNSSDVETADTQEGDNAFFTTVSNCQINGGEIGIRLEGANASRNIGNRVINNILDLCEDGGIFVDDQDSLSIIGNTITNLRNAFADGINLTDIMMFDISYNTVVNSPDWGLYIADGNFDAVPTSRGRVINNMVSATADFAIYFDDIEETDIFHNTAANTSAVSGAFRINDMTDVDIRNNIFYSEGDFAFESDDPITNNTPANVVDFNSYWSNGPNLIDDGFTVSADLVAWQTAQPTANIGSIEVDPVFVSTTDFHVISPFVNDLGDPTIGIIDDVDGDARPLAPGVTPDMGADEFTPFTNNAVFSAFIDPISGSCGDSLNPITVIVKNLGTTITAMNIDVAVTGDATTSISFPYVGSLAFNESDTVSMGSFNSYSGDNFDLIGYVTLAGEEDTSNDTLTTSVTMIPFEPRGIDGIACDGIDTAIISGASIAGTAYFWYDAAVGGTQVGSGNDFTVPSVAAQSTYFVEYANNSDSLETTYATGSGCGGGNMIDVTALNTVSINAVSVHSGEPVGTIVPVTVHYIANSTALPNSANPAAWTTLGTYNAVSAGVGNSSRADFGGASFTIPAGATYAVYIEYDAEYTTGANVYANADLSIQTGLGLCSSFGGINNPRSFNGALHYGTTACSFIRTPVTVNIDATATAAFTSTTTGMLVDFDATATVGADSVLFDFGDGNTSTSLTPSNTYATSATYTVCLYAYSFCGIDTVCQTVDITVGVEELSATAAVKVFPNPSKGQFVLDLAKYNEEKLNVSVLNQLGKVIFNKTYSSNDNGTQQAIDLSAYSNGIYFLKLTSDEDVTTKKIIIQK